MHSKTIAQVAHAINAAYCASLSAKFEVVSWEDTDVQVQMDIINAVEVILKNPDITPSEMHENWMEDRLADGWKVGDKKSNKKKTHPNLVDFDLLPESEASKDFIFKAVVVSLFDVTSEVTHEQSLKVVSKQTGLYHPKDAETLVPATVVATYRGGMVDLHVCPEDEDEYDAVGIITCAGVSKALKGKRYFIPDAE